MIKLSAAGAAGMLLHPDSLFASELRQAPFSLSDFGNDFLWGTASASYQIEGAWDADGKGPSIWDTFTRRKGKILDGSTGDVACDFYHSYESDIELVRQIGFKVFRFSIAWTRIFPQGTGEVNQAGIDFYHRVIDTCLAKGIQPWITLYHWDLPQALQDRGGWENREVVDWFAAYTDTVTKAYGDKVKNWMVLNEPAAFTAVGHILGMHAPGKKSFKAFLKTVHHATLAQAEGGRVVRRNVKDAYIGSTFSCMPVDPKTMAGRHVKSARKMDALFNRLFIEPALGMGYPIDGWKGLRRLEKYMQPGDEERMKFDFDFIGLQNYTRLVTRFSLWPPVIWANQQKPHKRTHDVTQMEWEVYPEGIYRVIKQFDAYEGIREIIITENGAAFPDELVNGRVHDDRRLKFYQDYIWNVLKAKKEGVNLKGYFAWTFLDNFEWAEGYTARFGLVHVDFETQQRTLKDSALWWQHFLNQN